MDHYDVIVLGTGGIGSAAAFHLARRGARVLGLDRFSGAHAHGSSHGQTRIIRKAYFEHPDYVPLLERAYDLWAGLEEQSGETLYHPVGLVEIGPPDGAVVSGVLQAARQHGLKVERFSAAELSKHFPFAMADGDIAVFEPDAGYLLVERSVLAHLTQAELSGAELVTGEEVVEWRATPHEVIVRTTTARYRAAKLVVTTGPWAADMLGGLGIRLTVRRKHLHWYANSEPRYRADQGCPGFFFETVNGLFYGFPQIDDTGVKVSEHSGGATVADPLTDEKSPEPGDRARVEAFLQSHLPGVSARSTRHEVCYYTMSPDEHFIVDHHPAHPNVAFAAGLSGHGFKFASVLGEVLAELTLEGASSQPIDFLNCRRRGVSS